MNPRQLEVRKGDPVLPAWRRLNEWLAQSRIHAGKGILLSRTRLGVTISTRAAVVGHQGAFWVTISGDLVTVGEGYVNGILPWIGKAPITGTEKLPAPTLKLDPAKFDDTGRSWIVIRVEVDEEGKIREAEGTEPPLVTIVQSATREDENDKVGLKPIAMLKRAKDDKKGLGRHRQTVWHDLQHFTSKQNDRFRHFFVPA